MAAIRTMTDREPLILMILDAVEGAFGADVEHARLEKL
jgi:hypothetical protein